MTGPGRYTRLLPPQAQLLIGWLRAALADDRGEVGIVGTVILVVGFAAVASALAGAVTGKLQGWIAKIPG